MEATLRGHSVRVILVLALLISTVGVGVAVAHHTRHIASYDIIVAGFGIDTFSEPLPKVGSTRGVDNNTSIEDNRVVSTSITRGTSAVTGRVRLTSGSRVLISYFAGQNLPGTGYRLRHETAWHESTRVRTRGSWSPDER